jgi:hypothetical protein
VVVSGGEHWNFFGFLRVSLRGELYAPHWVMGNAAIRPFFGLPDGRWALPLLIEAVTDYAIYMLDPTGIVTSWNPGAQRFTTICCGIGMRRMVRTPATASRRWASKRSSLHHRAI